MDLNRLKYYKKSICDSDENKEYSILIPIIDINDSQHIVFQVRSGRLLKQPNEICFPGGRIEAGENPQQAAVRETCEELLIDQANIHVLGELDTLVTPFNTIIYSYAAQIANYEGTYSKDEVQEVFYVPLDFLRDYKPQCSYLDVSIVPHEDFPFEKIQYGKAYPWAKGTYPVYIYEYQGKVIWGITARILRNFIEIIQNKA